jgi:lipopolysaccharide export system protein LptC
MISRAVTVPDERPAPVRAEALARPPAGSAGAADRYSRRVALLKRVLPTLGLSLLLLVAAWPRLSPLLESVRLGLPAIDLREARELKMVHPRYVGIDRLGRPYVVTAAIGRQMPNRDDLMALEQPRADMTTHRAVTVMAAAATGVYQSQVQLLDLFDDVTLARNDGTRFLTRRAHLDLSDSTAEGHDPVAGHGPSGDIAAQGFSILSKGDTIIFTGHTDLLLKGSKPSAVVASPAALPAEVEQAAARIEAAANATPVAEPPSRTNAAKRVAGRPASARHTTAKRHSATTPIAAAHHGDNPPMGKVRHDAG